jgi:hypothetical protein
VRLAKSSILAAAAILAVSSASAQSDALTPAQRAAIEKAVSDLTRLRDLQLSFANSLSAWGKKPDCPRYDRERLLECLRRQVTMLDEVARAGNAFHEHAIAILPYLRSMLGLSGATDEQINDEINVVKCSDRVATSAISFDQAIHSALDSTNTVEVDERLKTAGIERTKFEQVERECLASVRK